MMLMRDDIPEIPEKRREKILRKKIALGIYRFKIVMVISVMLAIYYLVLKNFLFRDYSPSLFSRRKETYYVGIHRTVRRASFNSANDEEEEQENQIDETVETSRTDLPVLEDTSEKSEAWSEELEVLEHEEILQQPNDFTPLAEHASTTSENNKMNTVDDDDSIDDFELELEIDEPNPSPAVENELTRVPKVKLVLYDAENNVLPLPKLIVQSKLLPEDIQYANADDYAPERDIEELEAMSTNSANILVEEKLDEISTTAISESTPVEESTKVPVAENGGVLSIDSVNELLASPMKAEPEFLSEEDERLIENDDSSLKCKSIDLQTNCDVISHCYWSQSTKSCRTHMWAMSCEMTQLKHICQKLTQCEWRSKSRSRGRFCREKGPFSLPEFPGSSENVEQINEASETFEESGADTEEEDDDDDDDEEEIVKCKYLVGQKECEIQNRCYWKPESRVCRTHPWAMSCSMTQLRSTCMKIGHCDWASRSKVKGKFCRDREMSDDFDEDDETPAMDLDFDVTTGAEDSNPRCKRLATKGACEEWETCFWSPDGKGCKTHLWAMSCSMTQLKSTCLQMANCTWAAPNDKRKKGRFCTDQPVDNQIASIAKQTLLYLNGSETPADQDSSGSSKVTVRIGAKLLDLWKCKSLKSEPACSLFPHCSWGSTGCKFKDAFTPCTSTSLKARCETLPHCVWSAASKSKGKYCFDKYYLQNPEDLDTKCTRIKSQTDCAAQVACEWRSNSKTAGKFCERQVSLSKAQEELEKVFPSFTKTMLPSDPETKNTSRFFFNQDASIDDLVGCPLNTECASLEYLGDIFGLPSRNFAKLTSYRQSRCCELHSEYVKMLQAISTHFTERKFKSWWIDNHFLLGMEKLHGMMPPWQNIASISLLAKSSRTVRDLMDKFNEDFKFRPYSVRACGDSSKAGEASCKALQKFSSKRNVLYYSIAHMDIENGPELRVYPRIISRTEKRCIFLTDSKPIPLTMVSPTAPCPFPLYNINVRCPRFIEPYLDIKYGKSWRRDSIVLQQDPAPAWDSERASNILYDDISSESSLPDKLFWLRKHHCPT